MLGSELVDQTLEKLGDDPSAPAGQQFYSPGEVLDALNMMQRLFVLLTLCLERQRTYAVTSRYLNAMTVFGDWITPLRIRDHTGAKIKAGRYTDLAALDNMWSRREGSPTRYAIAGFGFLGFYKFVAPGFTADFTYARSPLVFNRDGGPEIPEEYHPVLMDGAIPLLRIKEGQQEWQKVLPQWSTFMDEVGRCAKRVRARNMEQGYDALPPELRKFDLSQFLRRVKKTDGR